MVSVKNLLVLPAFCGFLIFLGSCNHNDLDNELLFAPKTPVINEISDITATGCTITWDAITNADGYLLDVLAYPPRDGYSPIEGFDKKRLTGVSCVLTGLSANSTYGIVLYSRDGKVVSPPSEMKIVTTIP